MKKIAYIILATILLYAYMHKDLILASLYLKDNNPNNDTKAEELLINLSKQNNVDANFLLGYYYKTPKYHNINYQKSFYYYNLASNLGDKKAKMIVAWYYYKGLGTPKNKEMAKKLLKELAVNGDNNALEILKFVLVN